MKDRAIIRPARYRTEMAKAARAAKKPRKAQRRKAKSRRR